MPRMITLLFKSLFCKPIENSFAFDKFQDLRIFCVGDKVAFKRFFLFETEGEIHKIYLIDEYGKYLVWSVDVKVNGKIQRKCPQQLTVKSRRQSFFELWEARTNADELQSIYQDICKAPNSVPIGWLELGIEALALCNDESLAALFFNAMLKETKDIESYKSGGFETAPNYIFKAVIERVYTQAVTGQSVDKNMLILCAQYISKEAENASPYYWTDIVQERYLSGVRMALLANDLELAKSLLKSKRSFKHQKHQKTLLNKIVKQADSSIKDVELIKDVWIYFDSIRRPFSDSYICSPNFIGVLEWRIIIENLLYNRSLDCLDWQAIIKDIYK